MADTPLLGAAIQQALQQFSTERHAGVPDGELLNRFAAQRDEVSFETLVRRHGPMVYGTAIKPVKGFSAVFSLSIASRW